VKSIVVATSADTLGRNQKVQAQEANSQGATKATDAEKSIYKGQEYQETTAPQHSRHQSAKTPLFAIQIPVHTAMP